MRQVPQIVKDIANDLLRAGGECFLVGGFVRDLEIGIKSKDIDIEIHNLIPSEVEKILSKHGEVNLIGQSFGVYMLKNLKVDWSLPRKEISTGIGHKKFDIEVDPFLGIESALKRRDFTINAMAISMNNWSLIDPFNGKKDLQEKILRYVDKETFIEDPLRVLRGAQFCARLEVRPDLNLITACKEIRHHYSFLARERIWTEVHKLLMKGTRPSLGIKFLKNAGWLHDWPEINQLFLTPQDPRHHPEGDVGIHTYNVIDKAAKIRNTIKKKSDRLPYMLACLLHDVGKITTTEVNKPGGITSYGHDRAGIPLVKSFLSRLTNEEDLIQKVIPLVGNHMFPHSCMFAKQPAYRRLQKKVDPYLLGKVCEADGLKPDHKEQYYKMLKEVGQVAPENSNKTIVLGRDLIEYGLTPGPEFSKIIKECEELFLETGIRNPKTLIKEYLEKEQQNEI